MLTSRIHVPPPADQQPEDIFCSSLPALFPDDIQNSHGNAGDHLIYQSPHYGDIQILLPLIPDRGDRWRLFAHSLWNAGVLVADMIEHASHCDRKISHTGFWNVRGERILELGAGAALPSIISILAAASEVCITDHPSSPTLTSGTIQTNVQKMVERIKRKNISPIITIHAHEWGSVTDAFVQANSDHYTKIIAADCLWMPSQHRNLHRSMAHFLSNERPQACALVVAGFHTGRKVVAEFFKQFSTSVGEHDTAVGLTIAEIYESDMHGVRRPWLEERANEGKEDLKRWCVVAVIVRHRDVFTSHVPTNTLAMAPQKKHPSEAMTTENTGERD